jgi:hypothetical protein
MTDELSDPTVARCARSHDTERRDRDVAADFDPQLATRRLSRRCTRGGPGAAAGAAARTPLSDDQIKEVVRNITADGSTALADGSIDKDEIGAFIKDVTNHDAGPENIKRVAAKLAAGGWPLAGVDDTAV